MANDLALDDVDINLDDSDEMEGNNNDNLNNRIDSDKLNAVDNDLDAYDDFANSLNKAIGDGADNNLKGKQDQLKIDMKAKEIEDIKNIFEKIDEFDNIFGTMSPDARSPDQSLGEDDEAAIVGQKRQEVPMNRNSFGMSKSEIIV